MAKKNKKEENEDIDIVEDDFDEDFEDNDNESGSKGGCLKKIIIFIIIFTIFVGIPVAIIGFNVGGIRDKYLRPGLEKIPIIKNLLPPLEEETQEEPAKDEKQQTIDSLTKEIEDLNQEIARLKVFEQNQLEFKKQKQAFDEMIALNDPKAYASFYESIAPENAKELYKQAVNKEVQDKEFKVYIQTFEGMKKDAAKSILEELITTDMDLVITILQNLSSEKRSEILSVMDPKNAASCSKLLYPEKQQ